MSKIKKKIFVADLVVSFCSAFFLSLIYLLLFKIKYYPLQKEAYFFLLILWIFILVVQLVVNIVLQSIYNQSREIAPLKKIYIYVCVYVLDFIIIYYYYKFFNQYECAMLLCLLSSLLILVAKIFIGLNYLKVIRAIISLNV